MGLLTIRLRKPTLELNVDLVRGGVKLYYTFFNASNLRER